MSLTKGLKKMGIFAFYPTRKNKVKTGQCHNKNMHQKSLARKFGKNSFKNGKQLSFIWNQFY